MKAVRWRYGLMICALAASLIPGAAQAAGSAAAGQTFLWLAIILVLGRLSGFVERFGIPGVLGELLVGVLLGNLSLMGIQFFEKIGDDPILAVFAELGVVILLFQIGLETTLDDLKSVGWRALAVAVAGVVAPFALGTWIIGPWLLPGKPFSAYLFLGATLCATSVGITGRVFRDAKQLTSPEARIVLGAAVIDDVLGLIILAVVTGFVQSGVVSGKDVVWIVFKSLAFLIGAVVIGRALAPHLGHYLSAISAGMGMKLTLLLGTGLGLAWMAQHIGLAPIIGAFAAGVLLEPVFLKDFEAPEIVRDLQPHIQVLREAQAAPIRAILEKHASHHHEHLLEPLALFLVPVFFVYTGMQVQLQSLFDLKVMAIALAVTAAAVAGKVVSGLFAGSANKWIVGWGMVPRGEVGLIFAAIGRQLGVVSEQLFSVIVIMVILTTLMSPPVLAALLRRSTKTS